MINISEKQKRSIAKNGMYTTLAALAITALAHGKIFKPLHVASGIALIGFTAWHCMQNGACQIAKAPTKNKTQD